MGFIHWIGTGQAMGDEQPRRIKTVTFMDKPHLLFLGFPILQVYYRPTKQVDMYNQLDFPRFTSSGPFGVSNGKE